MIHTHAQCGLQIQNIIHKLMHFASETNTVCFTHIVQTKIFQVQTKIFEVQKKSFKYTKQFYKYGTRKLRVDRNAFAHGSAKRKISAKSHVTNKCPVIHTTKQQVALFLPNRTDSVRFPCGLALLPRHSRAS